jgi:hypothetical protein
VSFLGLFHQISVNYFSEFLGNKRALKLKFAFLKLAV